MSSLPHILSMLVWAKPLPMSFLSRAKQVGHEMRAWPCRRKILFIEFGHLPVSDPPGDDSQKGKYSASRDQCHQFNSSFAFPKKGKVIRQVFLGQHSCGPGRLRWGLRHRKLV